MSKNSTKITKRYRDFRDYEYNFDFLQKCVPITEIPEIAIPFQDFSTVFGIFEKFLLNALHKHACFYMVGSWRVPLIVTSHFYMY